MDTILLSSLIGKEISDISFHYIPENEYGLQSFHSYIKLNDGNIIDIPKFDDNVYLHLTDENLKYLQSMFNSGENINDEWQSLVVGQKISGFYFCYYENEIDVDFSAFISLSNGLYMSEKNFGPVGVTDVDLILFNADQFNAEVQRLKTIGVVVKQFEN